MTLVEGLITDAGVGGRDAAKPHGWYDVSTLREADRVEGKKTMGYELAEQFDWTLPDWIVYPTGGGTGIVGMWKAFDEMEAIGWLAPGRRPKMVTVQTEGCAPIVRAFQERAPKAAHLGKRAYRRRWPARAAAPSATSSSCRTSARAAAPPWRCRRADDRRHVAIGSSKASRPRPKAAATLSAVRQLVADGQIKPHETVVLFNTGGALKYLDLYCVIRPASNEAESVPERHPIARAVYSKS